MPGRLPQWAAWLGDVQVEFEAANRLGVLDHVLTLPSGESAYTPMRVVPAATPGGPWCEVVFTVRRRGQTADAFAADVAAVAADLQRFRELLEGDQP
jgi:hypothetical protein